MDQTPPIQNVHFLPSSSKSSMHSVETSASTNESSLEPISSANTTYSAEYSSNSNKKPKLGTLNGVFLPTLQTILGVLLFLRLPTITAQAGTIYTTVIILICVTSTLITAISLSAIATNGTIQKGGPYYVISRTLGLEVGGALGLLYYFAGVGACAMSVLGAAEAFLLTVGAKMPPIESVSEIIVNYPTSEEIIDLGLNPEIANIAGEGVRYLQEAMSSEEMVFGMPLEETMLGGMPVEELIVIGNNSWVLFPYETQFLSLVLVLILTNIVSVGFRFVDMASNLFLALVFLSIFCSILGCILFASGFHLGELVPWDRLFYDNIWPRYEPDPETEILPNFLSLIALFYPSVTGILAGSSRSELLINPAASIPDGTLGAIFCSTGIYIVVVWLFGLTIANFTLKTNKFVFAAVAFPHAEVVKIGVIVSCAGAALQYLALAAQLLDAIALDESMPILRFLLEEDQINVSRQQDGRKKVDDISDDGEEEDEERQPRRSLWLTWLLVSLLTLSGNLDHISPLTTMFFLLMYAGINISCFLLGVIKSPGFRPTFQRFHWSVSLFGSIWCLGLAIVIDIGMALLAIGLFALILLYNKKMVVKRRDWGDVFDSVKYNVVTEALRALSHTTTNDLNAKNWRPQLITFVGVNDTGRPEDIHILSLSSQLKMGKGINIIVGLLKCDEEDEIVPSNSICSRFGMENAEQYQALSKSKDMLHWYMTQERIEGFVEVSPVVDRNAMSGAVWSAILHSGLGPLSPNSVLLSYPSSQERSDSSASTTSGGCWTEQDFIKTIAGIKNMKIALLMFKGSEFFPRSDELVTTGRIDVWWIVHDGGLLLLIPYIMSKHTVWGKQGATLRIFAICTNPKDDPNRLQEAVKKHLNDVRITASVIVLDMSETTIAQEMRGGGHCASHQNSNISTDDDDIGRTHDDRTVGEVFSQIPYSPFVDKNDLETGGSTTTTPTNAFPEYTNNAGIAVGTAANAIALNKLLLMHSSSSNLIVTNMPFVTPHDPPKKFFTFVDTVCQGLNNILFVRGSGKEVITTYA